MTGLGDERTGKEQRRQEEPLGLVPAPPHAEPAPERLRRDGVQRRHHQQQVEGEQRAPDVVQRRLGHESITITVDRYGHISLERAAQAGDAIGIVLAGAMPELEQ